MTSCFQAPARRLQHQNDLVYQGFCVDACADNLNSLVYPHLTFLIRDYFLRFETTPEDYLEQLLRGPAETGTTTVDDGDDEDGSRLMAQLQQKSRKVMPRLWM
jgi:hypothetical protein